MSVLAPLAAARLIKRRLETGPPSALTPAFIRFDFAQRPEHVEGLPHQGGGDLRGGLETWLTAVLAAVMGGLLIQALLPDTVFVNGLEVFRGVKASLLLPLLLAGPVLYSREEIGEFLKRPVNVWALAAASAAAFAVTVLLERSGNLAGGAHPLELKLRSALECLFGARPRFKEFFIGHPFLVLGLYLAREKDGNPSARQAALLCVWIGVVGLVSIVNNFCHLHTPLTHSLLRTFHGLWLGGLLGLVLIFALRFIRRKT